MNLLSGQPCWFYKNGFPEAYPAVSENIGEEAVIMGEAFQALCLPDTSLTDLIPFVGENNAKQVDAYNLAHFLLKDCIHKGACVYHTVRVMEIVYQNRVWICCSTMALS